MKNISILGSTGSIGKSTLDVVDDYKTQFRILGLTANRDIQSFATQINRYQPLVAAIADKESYLELKKLVHSKNTEIVCGVEGLIHVATLSEVDLVMSSIVGAAGLLPTIEAIKAKKTILLANKEVLVMAGELVNHLMHSHQVMMLPVDSEHNAIFQCLKGSQSKEIEKIILTASGGPFRYLPLNEFSSITKEKALKHPNWDMGAKITIDSATMMNKGLELIEARWLFDLEEDKIDIIIHPESVIHSMVQFVDGSVLAQLGVSDMKIPIQFSLTYPERLNCQIPRVDFSQLGSLNFLKPDLIKFPALRIARECLKQGASYPIVLNAANEIAVQSFLEDKIHYVDIVKIIEKVLTQHQPCNNANLDEIIQIDEWSRKEAIKCLNLYSTMS